MSLRRFIATLASYFVLASLLLLPLSAHMGSRLPDDGDAILGLWIVWWSATNLFKGYPEIFDANAFYPHPQGLLYSEPMIGEGLLSWPLFNGLENPVFAMNLLTLITLALSATAAHMLFKEITDSEYGAVVGAIAYTFSAYSFSQIPRIQLITLQWLPLALYCLHRYFNYNKSRYLIGFTVFSILQALSCFYYLAFYLVILTILIPALFLATPERRNLPSVINIGIAGFPVGAVLALMTVPYWLLYRHYQFQSTPSSYNLLRYFEPRSESLLYQSFNFPTALVDHFIGYFVLLLASVGFIAMLRLKEFRNRLIGVAYSVIAVLGFFLSAGPDLKFGNLDFGQGPYVLLQKLPPYDGLRNPDRFSILVTLGIGLFVAYGVAWLVSRYSSSRGVTLSCILSVVVLAEHWSPSRTQGKEIPTGNLVPDVYRKLSPQKVSTLAELPPRPFREMRHVTLDAYFSTYHGNTLLFNKPSFYPPAMELLEYELRRFPARYSVTLLRALGVSRAIIHPKRWPSGDRFRALRRLPEITSIETFPDQNVPLWNRLKLGGEHLVTFAPLEEEGAPRACNCREIPRSTLRFDSNGIGNTKFVIDNNPSTKWTTGDTPIKGDFFEVAFDQPRRPIRIELDMAFPYGEFPRHLEVNGFSGEHAFRMQRQPDVWQTVALVRQLVKDPAKARYRINLQPETVDRIRMFINVTERGSRRWSISELHVYEDLDPEN